LTAIWGDTAPLVVGPDDGVQFIALGRLSEVAGLGKDWKLSFVILYRLRPTFSAGLREKRRDENKALLGFVSQNLLFLGIRLGVGTDGRRDSTSPLKFLEKLKSLHLLPMDRHLVPQNLIRLVSIRKHPIEGHHWITHNFSSLGAQRPSEPPITDSYGFYQR